MNATSRHSFECPSMSFQVNLGEGIFACEVRTRDTTNRHGPQTTVAPRTEGILLGTAWEVNGPQFGLLCVNGYFGV